MDEIFSEIEQEIQDYCISEPNYDSLDPYD